MKYNTHEKKFFACEVPTIKKNPIGVIGDYDKIMKVRRELYLELEKDDVKDFGSIDMQPLRVLMKYINDPNTTTIAGYPQMVKVYPFMRVLPWGFIHTKKDGTKFITYFCRPLLDYETFPYPMYDLKTGEVKYMKATIEEFKRQSEKTMPFLHSKERIMIFKMRSDHIIN